MKRKGKLLSSLVAVGLFFSQINIAKADIVLQKYSDTIPESVKVNIKESSGQPKFLNYVYIKSVSAPIRTSPSANARIIVNLPFNAKLKVLEKVQSEGNNWYKIELVDTNGNKEEAYVSEHLAEFRGFRFEEMERRIEKLQSFLKSESAEGKELAAINTYRPNPSNSNMSRVKDKYGVSADQNAKASYNGEIIYIPDRSLLSIESIKGDTAYVNVCSIPEKSLKVNKNVLTRYPAVNPNFRKVIAIDLENENQGIFEKNSNGEWELIAYTLNKTGIESALGFETPRGYYLVPTLKYEMGYRDEYNKASGFAKYAIRFCGGGYIHGTPIEFKEDINRDFFLQEKDGTLGTVEGTRKCIRNMESHIQFLFHWATNGKINRNSNAQSPAENIMVIVF